MGGARLGGHFLRLELVHEGDVRPHRLVTGDTFELGPRVVLRATDDVEHAGAIAGDVSRIGLLVQRIEFEQRRVLRSSGQRLASAVAATNAASRATTALSGSGAFPKNASSSSIWSANQRASRSFPLVEREQQRAGRFEASRLVACHKLRGHEHNAAIENRRAERSEPGVPQRAEPAREAAEGLAAARRRRWRTSAPTWPPCTRPSRETCSNSSACLPAGFRT